MMDVQLITAPDGSQMVVMPKADYEYLLAAAEDRLDIADATAAMDEANILGMVPSEVVDAMLEGATPVAAWRRYRGLSQAELARRAGMTQPGMRHFETRRNGRAHLGRRESREALAGALGIHVRMLETD
jgi:hypothetical protein